MIQRQMSNTSFQSGPGISPQDTRSFNPVPQNRPPVPNVQARWMDAEKPQHKRDPSRPSSSRKANQANGGSTRAGSHTASDDEDDQEEVPGASTGPWNSMLSLVEAARLKADNHESKDDAEEGLSGKDTKPAHPFDFDVGGPPKKRRRSDLEEADRAKGVMLQRGTHKHMYKNPLELGMLTVERGKQLFDQ